MGVHDHVTASLNDVDAVIYVHGVSRHQPLLSIERLITEYRRTRYDAKPGLLGDVREFPLEGERTAQFYQVLESGEETHFYEALWSPMTKQRISTIRVALWAFFLSLFPVRFEARSTLAKKRNRDRRLLFSLGWILSVFFGIAVVLATAVAAAVQTFGSHIEWFVYAGLDLVVALGGWYLLVALLMWRTSVRTSETYVRLALVYGFAVLALTAYLPIHFRDPNLLVHFIVMIVAAVVAVLALLGARTARAIDDLLADVFIAATNDINENAFIYRDKVTNHVAELVLAVLRETTTIAGHLTPRYRRVILVGHSLGSVIAFDALTRVVQRARASDDPFDERGETDNRSDDELSPILRLTALVTFGSPLEKLATLRGWNDGSKVSTHQASLRDEVINVLAERTPSGLPRWVNFWTMSDPISDPLAKAHWLKKEDPTTAGDVLERDPPAIHDVELILKREAHTAYIFEERFWNDLGAGINSLLRG